MPDHREVCDLTIIGAGPVGLAAAFWAGMREASARIVDALPEIGGQLTALYPDKWIYDVPGHPRIRASELVELHRRQTIDQFGTPVHLDTTARRVDRLPASGDDGKPLMVLETDRGPLLSRTIVIAGGHGAFEPKTLPGLDLSAWDGRGVHYFVKDKDAFVGKRTVIVGGGDSACDWALNLLDCAERVSLVHRRAGFRAHERTVADLTAAARDGHIDLHVPYQVREVRGDGTVQSVRLFRSDDPEDEIEVACDAVLVQLGFLTRLGPLGSWGLEIEDGAIKVDQAFRTNLDGVWACGDIATFGGKLKLIATGYAEAAIAVAQALHSIRADMKIQPRYSTNTGVPGVVPGEA